jgi:hypothetical protein
MPEPFSRERSCPACGSTSLTNGRLSATVHDQVDLYACDDCGDFWFERSGVRLTAAAMRNLGLLP